MKLILLLAATLLTACSGKPIVDLRGSGDTAHLYQRDLHECQLIIDDNRSIWHKPLLGTDPMLEKCLENRGHSVLHIR